MPRKKKKPEVKKAKTVTANKHIIDNDEPVVVSRNIENKEKSLKDSVIQSRNIQDSESLKQVDDSKNTKFEEEKVKTEPEKEITEKQVSKPVEESNVDNSKDLKEVKSDSIDNDSVKEKKKPVQKSKKKIRSTKKVKKTEDSSSKKEKDSTKKEKVEDKETIKDEKKPTKKVEKKSKSDKQSKNTNESLISDKKVEQKRAIKVAQEKPTFRQRFTTLSLKGDFELRYKGIKFYDSINSDFDIKFEDNFIKVGNKTYPYVGTRLINK